jgi:hypothetical protein
MPALQVRALGPLQTMILHVIFRHSYFETFFVEFGKITGLKLNFRYFMVCSNP